MRITNRAARGSTTPSAVLTNLCQARVGWPLLRRCNDDVDPWIPIPILLIVCVALVVVSKEQLQRRATTPILDT